MTSSHHKVATTGQPPSIDPPGANAPAIPDAMSPGEPDEGATGGLSASARAA